jgi:tetrahydromethanopterin S-methyltransferase subunit B
MYEQLLQIPPGFFRYTTFGFLVGCVFMAFLLRERHRSDQDIKKNYKQGREEIKIQYESLKEKSKKIEKENKDLIKSKFFQKITGSMIIHNYKYKIIRLLILIGTTRLISNLRQMVSLYSIMRIEEKVNNSPTPLSLIVRLDKINDVLKPAYAVSDELVSESTEMPEELKKINNIKIDKELEDIENVMNKGVAELVKIKSN